MQESDKFFPLMVDLTDKKIAIFGGGMVAEGKAIKFLTYAKVIIISQNFTAALLQHQEKAQVDLYEANLQALTDDEIKDHLTASFLVIPATSDKALNIRIANLAKSLNILVNDVDNVGEVILPSIINEGDLMIAISTQGKSPALSKYTRKKLQQVVTPEYAAMSRLQTEMRVILKNAVIEQGKRKEILWQILNSEKIWSALSESYEKALQLSEELILK